MPLAPRLARVRALAIDLDGTLLDTIHDLAAAANLMLGQLGLRELPKEQLRTFVGRGMANLIGRSLAAAARAEPEPELIARATPIYEARYLEILGRETAPFPGVLEGLRTFRALGLRLACVTNKLHAFAQAHLDRAGMADEFELLVGGDTLAAKKPDPLPLLHVARTFGVRPDELLVLGDSGNDAQAARAAGSPVLLLPYGYTEGRPVQEIEADGIVDSFVTVGELLRARQAAS
jgi:phosphoglycolate phosphatase